MTHTDQSILKRMETTTTTSFENQSGMCVDHAENGLNSAMTAKLQHGRNLTMKGKCNLCETKCDDEFCGGCVYYLQKKLERTLVTTRKTAPCQSDHWNDRVFRTRSNFLTLQTCQYDDG